MIRLSTPETGELHEFRPPQRQVTLYICGVTPYDAAHVGHVATFMTYDVLARRLRELGHDTVMVRNITDLDDPILGRAQRLGVEYWQLVEHEVAQLKRDLSQLNFLEPDAEPRVSEMLGETIEFIKQLDAAGHVYTADGHAYFDIATSPAFGSVSKYSHDLMLHCARERGGNPGDPRKRQPLDFLLWRPARPGEPVNDSPWGPGMPGWHIGCSAMARTLIGETVDLHGGGADLRFPHHECENAQTLALQNQQFARTWHHCELVSYRGAKMSKSLGNVVLARDLLRRHEPGAIRLAILRQYRYRAGCEWRDRDIAQGERLLALIQAAVKAGRGPDPRPWADRFRTAIDDDLDFPTAVTELEDLCRTVLSGQGDMPIAATVKDLCALLGVDLS